MTQIIGFSGKKQSGKNTACNFIIGHCMHSLGIVRNAYEILNTGELQISDLFGDTRHEGVFDINRPGKPMKEFLAKYLDEYVKLYSMADILKKEVCIKILGLKYEELYGTDEEKNRETHLRWEDMPGVYTGPKELLEKLKDLAGDTDAELDRDGPVEGRLGKYYDIVNGIICHEPGNMTAREVMQYVGTDIFRKMYNDVWVDALLRRINEDQPAIALICDIRFPNEVFGVQRSGGIVIRLTRHNGSNDQHSSETSLDPQHFQWSNFNYVLDNQDKSIIQTNEEVYGIMNTLGLIQEDEQLEVTTKKTKKGK